jgi:hypothetical protein
VVARATGTGTDEVVTSLEEAEGKGIVGIEGHRLYFTHPLSVRGICSESAPADRRRMHRQLAEILDEPELRARHLSRSDTGRRRGVGLTAAEQRIAGSQHRESPTGTWHPRCSSAQRRWRPT